MTQAIFPCDFNIITDDELVDMFSKIQEGVYFTMIAGTLTIMFCMLDK